MQNSSSKGIRKIRQWILGNTPVAINVTEL